MTHNKLQMEWNSLSFPSSADIAKVEEKYLEMFFESNRDPEYLLIDLKKCKYIEVPSLLWLLSTLQYRNLHSYTTQINLPNNKIVRDFLRVWRFPEAVQDITGKSFFNFSTEESHKYFGEIKNFYDLTYGGTILQNGMNRLLSDRFFSCTVFHTSKFISKEQDVLSESDRFNTQLVTSVLSRQLKGPVSYVASRIIFESIMNAIRHPSAKHFVIASLADGLRGFKSKSKRKFTITIWDDGKSMIKTIRDALINKKEIRARCDQVLLNYSFQVIYEDSEGKKSEPEIINSSYTPILGDTDERIFFSTILPGITCDVEGTGHQVHPTLKNDQPFFSSPGMGLHILQNAVVDVFGGELAFRSDRYFMNIKKSGIREEKFQYKVKIKSFPSTCPKFLGNMLTIRLPMNREETHEEIGNSAI